MCPLKWFFVEIKIIRSSTSKILMLYFVVNVRSKNNVLFWLSTASQVRYLTANYGNEVFCYFLLNTHSLMNNIFFFFFAFFLYLDIYGWILLAIAYVTMLSFDCVLKPITHSFNACESQHTSNSRYYVQRTLFRRVLACANFIQHKWLVDHSTSIATKAEFCWSEI